jgi:hypothetical protein
MLRGYLQQQHCAEFAHVHSVTFRTQGCFIFVQLIMNVVLPSISLYNIADLDERCQCNDDIMHLGGSLGRQKRFKRNLIKRKTRQSCCSRSSRRKTSNTVLIHRRQFCSIEWLQPSRYRQASAVGKMWPFVLEGRMEPLFFFIPFFLIPFLRAFRLPAGRAF